MSFRNLTSGTAKGPGASASLALLGALTAVAVAAGIQASGEHTGRARPARFQISGTAAAALEPGKPEPLNLKLHNPHRAPISIRRLGVRMRRLSAPHATRTRPCRRTDFRLRQYRGRYPVVVPGRSARTLAGLGVARGLRPQITLRDRRSNQDGCQRARLTFSYSGTARVR